MHRFCSYILRFVVPVIRDRVMSGNAELALQPFRSSETSSTNIMYQSPATPC